MKKIIFLSVALWGYAFSNGTLESLAITNSYEIKALEAEIRALKTEVDLSGTWENPVLRLGVNDILFDEPLKRDKEPMQNESITLSQKIPTASKLDIKKGIANTDVALGELQLEELTLSLKKEIRILEHKLKKINSDLIVITEYEDLLERLSDLHVAYNYSESHFTDTFKTTITRHNIAIKKQRLLADQKATVYKIESIINQGLTVLTKETLAPLSYTLQNEEEVLLKHNPTLKKMRLSTQKATQNTHYSKSLKTPDITVSLGYYRRDGFDDYAALSLSMPLPVYGKETLAIQKSMQLQQRANEQLRAVENKLIFTLKDLLAEKNFMENQIDLNYGILSEKEKIYDNLKETTSTQKNALLGSLSIQMQMLDSKLKINQFVFEYNKSIETIKALIGEQ